MSDSKPTCFIIMPISTPDIYHERYKEDEQHFKHVLECLLIPAVEEAGFQAIPPMAEGSEHIHAKIISTLTDCDLVLCDMSILNANVFFELGVRTALDKPVALIADSETARTKPGIPFDVSNINFHTYNPSLTAWETKEEIPALVSHIEKCVSSSGGRSTLWKYYGISQTASLNPEDANIANKLDLLINENSEFRTELATLKNNIENTSKNTSQRNIGGHPTNRFNIELADDSEFAFIPSGEVKIGGHFSKEQLERLRKLESDAKQGIGHFSDLKLQPANLNKNLDPNTQTRPPQK